jgi:hypothetical protein
MALSKPLIVVLSVLLVAGGGVAATGVAQTDADASTTTAVSALEMDATLGNETVTVTVADDGTPVENASITVEGDEEVTVTTDANGTATVDRSNLTEDGESLEELEVEYETEHAEGSLEFVVQNDSLTLVEEKYEYDVEEDDETDEEERDEDDETDDEDDKREDDETDEEREDDD